jgi:O-methyltransferase
MPTETLSAVNPAETLLQIGGEYALSRCLHVVADLGIADALDDQPRTAAALAESTCTNADALNRVLRLLSCHGIFENKNGKFAHTDASRLLRSDHPRSMRSYVRMMGMPLNWAAYEKLDYTLRTGLPAMSQVLPGGFWSYFADHPEASQIFNEAMEGKAQLQIAGVIRAYSFSQFNLIGDIGGGKGHLLQAVLAANPRARGMLFDLPRVVEENSTVASDRLSLQGGDFFKDKMPACDAYLMMDIIHDWNDEESTRILKNLRRSAPAHAKLLIVEGVIHDDSKPGFIKVLDIHMMTLITGRQRTYQEFEKLLAGAGFRLEREIDAGGEFSIVEAVAV